MKIFGKQSTYFFAYLLYEIPLLFVVLSKLQNEQTGDYLEKLHFSDALILVLQIFLVLISIEIIFTFVRFLIKLFCYSFWKRTKIRYWVFYPFMYDGNLKFKPFSLINSKETQRDMFLLNLPNTFRCRNDESNLKDFKVGNIINEVSSFISTIAVIAILYQFVGMGAYFYLGKFILILLEQFKNYDYRLVGSRQVGKSLTLSEYYLSGNLIEEIQIVEYKNYLNEFKQCNENDLENSLEGIANVQNEAILPIFENYLYRLFNENREYLNIDVIEFLFNYTTNVSLDELFGLQGMGMQTRYRQLLYLIGCIGGRNNYVAYKTLFTKLSKQYLICLEKNSKGPVSENFDQMNNDFINLVMFDKKINSYTPYLAPILGSIEMEKEIEESLVSYITRPL